LAVAIGQDGSAYVTGHFFGGPITFGTNTLTSSGNRDVFLVKYDSGGNVVWSRRAGGAGDDSGSCIAVDSQGNVLLAGVFQGTALFGSLPLLGSSGTLETFIAKSDSNGNFLWANRVAGNIFFDDVTRSYRGITTDAQGNVYLTGSYYSNQFPGSGFVAKFDASESLIWNKPVAGAVASAGSDSFGNTYISGSFSGSISVDGKSLSTAGAIDTFIYKLNPSGTAIWAKQAGFIFDDICNGLTVDPAGNVFLTGTFHDTTRFDTNIISGNGDDVFIAKLGNNTVQLAPAIVAQPQSQTVSPGATATFGVVANGASPLRFQWRFNGTDITGGTNALLSITNALLANVGSYDVVMSNAAGSVISSAATLTVVPGTPNFADNFGARGIMIGFTNFVTGNNAAYTRESGEPDHAGRKGAHSAWLTWTAPDNGSCVMDTLGSSFDTVLAVYTGSIVSNLMLVTANDDSDSGGLQSRVVFNAVAGVTYQIVVDGYAANESGNISFRMSYSNSAPSIEIQPVNQGAFEGSNISFTVSALGVAPLSYQWRFNGTDIPGSTNATHTITSSQLLNEGGYSVVVANSFGSVTSVVATLSVFQRPMITDAPESQIVTAGESAAFSVNATGTHPLNYQWQWNGTNLPGATDSVHWIGNAQPSNGGNYAVVIANQCGSVTSIVARLIVNYSLTVGVTGGGTVIRLPNQNTFPPDEFLVLTAVPDAGFSFSNWIGDFIGTDNPLLLIMDSNKSITANFVSDVLLTIVNQGSGSVRKKPNRPAYPIGNIVTLTATPGSWHVFEKWDDGAAANPRIITIGPINNYTAIFTPTQSVETLTFGNVSRTAPVGMPALIVDGQFVINDMVTRLDSAQIELLTSFQNGTVLYTLDGSKPTLFSIPYLDPFEVKRTVTIRAIALDESFLNSWEAGPIRVNVEPTYTLQSHNAGGGTISVGPLSASYTSNTWVTLQATPDPGWTFLQWLGDASGTAPSNSVVMTRDMCVEAVFGTKLTTAIAGGGTLVIQPDTAFYPYGKVVRLTAVPDPGNAFALWSHSATSTNNPLSFRMTTADPSVLAVFGPLGTGQYSLTTIAEGFGSVTNKPRGNRFSAGATITITALPDTNQQFIGWSGDASGVQNPLTVTLNSSKVSIARFTKRPTLLLQPCSEPSLENGFQFLVSGEFGARYLVEKSQDGQSWLPLATLTNLFGVTQFNDVTVMNASLRMYRASPSTP